MKKEIVTDALLREFLLGKLNDEQRGPIEDLFLTDSEMRERVLALEQDLIEDYLEDNLTEEEKGRFLSRYVKTDEQQRNVRIIKSIKDWAVRESRTPHAPAATVSTWSRLWTRLRLKRALVIPIAVTIMIAIVLVIVLLNSWMEQRKHSAIEQELAQLNSPANLSEITPQAILDLRPVTVRSGESQPELKLRADIRVVELRLPWIQKERYLTYQAEVRRIGNGKSFMIKNVQVENDGRNVIRIRLPTHMLTQGHYQIMLTGIAPDGSANSSEEYAFAVRD
ncbi:MAG TPA: hypothetical protein VJ875_15585 [Pyrinomonadaceae bacterium]|nr:hypothetical protein [Pyrinomonadaceae bacterium]